MAAASPRRTMRSNRPATMRVASVANISMASRAALPRAGSRSAIAHPLLTASNAARDCARTAPIVSTHPCMAPIRTRSAASACSDLTARSVSASEPRARSGSSTATRTPRAMARVRTSVAMERRSFFSGAGSNCNGIRQSLCILAVECASQCAQALAYGVRCPTIGVL